MHLGQIRLCWQLNVMDIAQAEAKGEEEAQQYVNLFMEQLDVDEEVADQEQQSNGLAIYWTGSISIPKLALIGLIAALSIVTIPC